MTTNPLQLRKTIEKQKMNLLASATKSLLNDWELVKNIKFSIQIIENHKIVNFKEAQSDYYAMLEGDSDNHYTPS